VSHDQIVRVERLRGLNKWKTFIHFAAVEKLHIYTAFNDYFIIACGQA